MTKSLITKAVEGCFQAHLPPQERDLTALEGYNRAVERQFIPACPTTLTRAACEAIRAHLEGDGMARDRWVRTVETFDALDGDKGVRSRWLEKVLKGLR